MARSSSVRFPPLDHAKRPKDVSSLFYQGNPYSDWAFHNARKNRFYVLNLGLVIQRLGIYHTTSDAYFNRSESIIRQHTNWASQYDAKGFVSKHQIYPKEMLNAKKIGQALSIIVAMESAAAEKKSDINVYDYCRIVPAFYFIDNLDMARFEMLERHHTSTGMPDSFSSECAKFIRQKTDLIRDIARGYTATQWVCDKIVEFVKDHYPEDLAVGPVREAGYETPSHASLGTHSASELLRAPRLRDPMGPEGTLPNYS